MNFSHCNHHAQSEQAGYLQNTCQICLLAVPHCHLLVQTPIASCLDNSQLMTGLPTSNLVLLSSSVHRAARIIFLKTSQITSLSCLRFSIGFPRHQENSNASWPDTPPPSPASPSSSMLLFPLLVKLHVHSSSSALYIRPALPRFRVWDLLSVAWYVLPTVPQGADSSSIKSQLKCHLLREGYPVPL